MKKTKLIKLIKINWSKDKGWALSLIKNDNEWQWLKETWDVRLHSMAYKSVNPIPRWKEKIRYHIFMFKSRHEVYKRCHGCGTDYATYVIKNPNYETKDFWHVCERCVDFYDFKMSKKKIVSWNNEKAVVKK